MTARRVTTSGGSNSPKTVASAPDYPSLSAPVLDELETRLVGIVTLLQTRKFTPDQIRELTASVSAQLSITEELHRFKLTNADEPGFAFSPGESTDDS